MSELKIMINRKALVVYLILSFALAWVFFLLPIAFGEPGSQPRQIATTVFFMLAMWMPGISAILVTLFVKKEKFGSLNLNRLGPKRYYLWAWLLFPVLAILTGILTLIFNAGQLDLEFTMIKQSMAQIPGGDVISPGLIVIIQILAAFTLAPLFNMIFALGEELGWRGFLLPELLPLGQWKAVLVSGVIWGLWHAPAIWQGLNYPTVNPWMGILMMIVFTVLTGTIFSWLYLETRSPWAPALAHGALNAVASLPMLFLMGVDISIGGTVASVIGWLSLALFVSWLVLTKRFPVRIKSSEVETEAIEV
jgi:membrane protease YdiL (CAAX protease family)